MRPVAARVRERLPRSRYCVRAEPDAGVGATAAALSFADAALLLAARGITARVTISDERDYAVSFVIAETDMPAAAGPAA